LDSALVQSLEELREVGLLLPALLRTLKYGEQEDDDQTDHHPEGEVLVDLVHARPDSIHRLKGRCGASDAVEGGDVGQVAVKPVVVEAVADNEHVGNREAHVIDGDVYLTPAALVEEHARPHAPGPAHLEHPLQRVERQTRVDDVVDKEDVTVGDV